MEAIKVRFVGESPILMHNGRLANPLDEFAKKLKSLTANRKKTDADYVDIAKVELEGGLYIDKNGPYIPCDNLDACLKNAAKNQKLGKAFGSAVAVVEERVPLLYDGPRDVDGLWKKKFYDIRGVVVSQKRIQRCRAMFKDWSCEFTIAFDPQDIERRQVEKALQFAGRKVGLFDRRPDKGGRYGKFAVEVLS